ncbi:MAG: hypothetical protein ACKO6N_02970 [Myxococcota bacterium]
MKTFISSIATISLSVALLTACGGEKTEPAPAEQPAATAAPAAPTAAAAPAAAASMAPAADPNAAAPAADAPAPAADAAAPAAPAATNKKAETKVASAASSEKKTVLSLNAQGDKARALAAEIRTLTEEIRKLSGELDANATAMIAAKQPAVIEATEKSLAALKEKAQTLDARSKNLKSLIAEMNGEVDKLK